MPIRINLKELFPADAQEITIDKINFNFNKLLALGVGEPGPIGLSGIQGSAGPIGGTGSQGVRGSTWLVDAGAPTITTGLLDGDLYLDSTALAVYQWDAATSTWNFLFDISAIVQNYLNAAQSPFIRGFGAGSPQDQRFILFGNRDGDPLLDEAGNSGSTNDILFLSNYNDATLLPAPPTFGGSPSTDEFYNALLSISVDQRSNLLTARSHIELGAVYNPANPTLTSLDENFKVKYERLVGGSIHPGLDHYNRLNFSLDVFDSSNTGARTFSSVFAFTSPKYLPSDPVNIPTSVFIGSRYGLDEEAPAATSGSTLADGIVFKTSAYGANIGIATKYTVPGITGGANTGYINNNPNTQAYFMLDSLGSTTALFLNDTIYQNGGNIVQLGTTAARIADFDGQGYSVPVASLGQISIVNRGDSLYVLGADSNLVGSTSGKKAYFSKLSITNPNKVQTGATTDFPASATNVTNAYIAAGATQPHFAGIADAEVTGELLYVVNNQSQVLTSTSPRIQFQTLKLDIISDVSNLKAYPAVLGTISNQGTLDCANRIKLAGKYAIVATNALPHSPTVNNLGGNGSDSTYDGRITAIDISNDNSSTVIASQISTKVFSGSAPNLVKSAFMDLAIIDNYAYTLTWEQRLDSTNARVKVHIDAFNISELDSTPSTITWKNRSTTTYINNSSVDSTLYSNLSKTGAIDVTSRYVYSAYSVYAPLAGSYTFVFKIHDAVKTTSSQITQAATYNIPASANIKDVLDLKHFGNSVFILGNTAAGESYVFKIDVSTVGTPFLVWEKKLEYLATNRPGGRFTIIGKNIYVATHDAGSGNGGVITLDFDGFYTTGAHIESLRVDDLVTIGDTNIGGHLTVNSNLNVGNDAKFTGTVGIGSDLVVYNDIVNGGDTVTFGSTAVVGNVTVGGSITATGDIITSQPSSFIGPGTIPLGGVIMWSGLTTNVPAGWALCNGAAISTLSITLAQKTALQTAMGYPNLPSLVDRFIVGAGSTYAVRAAAGQDQITLTRANIPPHKHKYAFFSLEGGSSWNNSGYINNISYPRGNRNGPITSSIEEGNDANFDYYDYESHTKDGTDNFNNDLELANGTGTVTPIDNKPLYCALAYIIRIY